MRGWRRSQPDARTARGLPPGPRPTRTRVAGPGSPLVHAHQGDPPQPSPPVKGCKGGFVPPGPGAKTGHGGRAPRLRPPRSPSSSRAPLTGNGAGGRAGAHLGLSSGLALSGTRAQKGAQEVETRRGPSTSRPGPSACLYGRAPTASRTGPGPRLKVRAQHPGKVGGRRWRGCARSHRRGRGTVGRPPSCLPLLTCVLGGVRTTPLPPRRGEGPLLAVAFTAFKFPWGPRLLPPPFFHCFF